MDKKRVRPSKSSRLVIEMAAPNIRPCVVCKEDRPIVAQGLCDRCRKRQERAENRLLYTPASAVSAAKGSKNLATLYKLMDECRVAGDDKRAILQRFLPYSALPANVQAAHLEALRHTDAEGDDGWDVHEGSSLAPEDSLNREPE
jgi:hypothetical protein